MMTNDAKKVVAPIRYAPMPGAHGGLTHLTIYPPGTFMNNICWEVFVGGCGVGQSRTLRSAQRLLLKKAKQYAQRQIDEAERIKGHYEDQLWHLTLHGLGKRVK